MLFNKRDKIIFSAVEFYDYCGQIILKRDGNTAQEYRGSFPGYYTLTAGNSPQILVALPSEEPSPIFSG